MEVTSIEKRNLGKSDVLVPAVSVGTILCTPKILSVLVFVIFVFTGCEIYEEGVEEVVIPTSYFTNQGSSDITGVVSVENIVASVRGSGSLVLSGTCHFADISVQSSGSFIGSSLEIRVAEVNSRGSGHTYVWATDRLNVKIQGSGNVYYKGNPQISSIIQGSGKLIKN